MKTLEQVKEYFKNAKQVRCIADGSIHDMGEIKEFENSSEGSFYVGNVNEDGVFNSDDEYATIYEIDGDQFAEIIDLNTIKVLEAVKSIGSKAEIMKFGADKALTTHKDMIAFVDMMLEQYNKSEGIKTLMNNVFGNDVMKCLIEWAKHINAMADIQLMEAQSKEENNIDYGN